MASKTHPKISPNRIKQLHTILKRLKVDYENNILGKGNDQKSLAIINEALTHTSAQAPINHEKLEFLGDAVLRLAASEFIALNFPNMKVGDRSALRAQLVSDRWLTNLGRNLKIVEIMHIGPNAAGDPSAKATLEAEGTEALIGALYECLKNLEVIHNWLAPHWEITSKAVLADPHRQNSKSALQEWSQGKGLDKPEYSTKEQSKKHGDSQRFFCTIHLNSELIGEGFGGSRQDAEKAAAAEALKICSKLESRQVPTKD